jgi:hypothetical protein
MSDPWGMTPEELAEAAELPSCCAGRWCCTGSLDAVGHDLVDAVEEPVDLGPPAAATQPPELGADPLGRADDWDDPARRGAMQDAEVEVAPGGLPGLRIQHQVVVGQLDGASPPPPQRLGDGDLQLTGGTGLLEVEAVHPRVRHRLQRVGVVQQVGGMRAGRSLPGGDRALQRRRSSVGPHRGHVGCLAEGIQAGACRLAEERDDGGGDPLHPAIQAYPAGPDRPWSGPGRPL